MKDKEIQRTYDFVKKLSWIRRQFPKYAPELDRCIFEVGKKYLDCCGQANCECQMSFEEFHRRQNIIFGTEFEAEIYEFN